ncbi:ESCO2 acetyltransferase, partial [Picathartes gymnocephalus]|nr:ESCO2 acetyltransferase [Picathartes gymnocephalus]
EAGQQGALQCGSCGMLLAAGVAEDRLQHLRHHLRLRHALRFPGWKSERVVAEFWDGRIVLVLPGDPKYALSKAWAVLEQADAELGFPGPFPGQFPGNSRLYLFIHPRGAVIGCAEAQPIRQ